MYQQTRSNLNARTTRVSNLQGHITMTATIVKEHTQEEAVFAQTGGNDHDAKKSFAQTQPKPRKGARGQRRRLKNPALICSKLRKFETDLWGRSTRVLNATWKTTLTRCGKSCIKHQIKIILWMGRSQHGSSRSQPSISNPKSTTRKLSSISSSVWPWMFIQPRP